MASWEREGDERARCQLAYNAGVANRLRELNDYQRAPSLSDSQRSALTAVLLDGLRRYPDVLSGFYDPAVLAATIVALPPSARGVR